MNSKTSGIALLVIGILMMIYTGFNFKTTENVVDLGPLQVNQEKNHPVKWSPIIGGILIVGGIVLIATSKNKS